VRVFIDALGEPMKADQPVDYEQVADDRIALMLAFAWLAIRVEVSGFRTAPIQQRFVSASGRF
jgi:hypothetical protein